MSGRLFRSNFGMLFCAWPTRRVLLLQLSFTDDKQGGGWQRSAGPIRIRRDDGRLRFAAPDLRRVGQVKSEPPAQIMIGLYLASDAMANSNWLGNEPGCAGDAPIRVGAHPTFRSARLWAEQPSVPRTNCPRSFRFGVESKVVAHRESATPIKF
jgi:hypothetical protein